MNQYKCMSNTSQMKTFDLKIIGLSSISVGYNGPTSFTEVLQGLFCVSTVVAASLSSSLPPAEDALVGTGEAGGRLHASVGLNAVESVFVTAPSPSQHRL